MSYTNVNEFIKDLIRARQNGITIDNFNGNIYSNLNRSELWKNLIDFLKNEADSDKLDTSPILQTLFNEDNGISLYNFINSKCDLDNNEIWNNLKNKIANNIDLDTETGVTDGTPYFWNESVNKIVAQFIKNLDGELAEIYLGKHNDKDIYMAVSDIKNGDAGNSFNDEEWVKPWTNIDEESYSEVRDTDKIQTVLNNSKELQFTRDKDNNKWLRLLMPKYLRKVEVEDLNRNFWVLAQVISGISAYLFGNNSIEEILKGILNELIQLWENTLYLWAAIALISQKDKTTDIHVEVVPIANSEIQNYIKFDNFGATATTQSWAAIKSRVQYVIDSYPNSNVIVVPQIKKGNYKHNWYSCEEYPGLIIYNRNTDTTSYLEFNLGTNRKWPVIDLEKESQLVAPKFINKLGAIREADEFNYKYGGDFMSTRPQGGGDVEVFYALLRSLPIVTAHYDTTNDIIIIDNFALNFYDVAAELSSGNSTLILSYYKDNNVIWDNNNTNSSNWKTIVIQESITTDEPTSTPSTFTIEKGYYQGELISYQNILAEPRYTITFAPQYGQRLIRSQPKKIEEYINDTAQLSEVYDINETYAEALYNNLGVAKAVDTEEESLQAIKGVGNPVSDVTTIQNLATALYGNDTELRREIVLCTLTHRTRYSTNTMSTKDRYFYTSNSLFLADSSSVISGSDNRYPLNEENPVTFYIRDNSNKFADGHSFSGSVSTAACLINRNVATNQIIPYNGYFFQASSPISGITGAPQRLNNFHLFVNGNDVQESNWAIIYAECAHGKPLNNSYSAYYDPSGYIVTKIFIHIFLPNGEYYRRVIDRSGDIKKYHMDDLTKWAYSDYSSGSQGATASSDFLTIWNNIHANFTDQVSVSRGIDYSRYWNTGYAGGPQQIAYENGDESSTTWGGEING